MRNQVVGSLLLADFVPIKSKEGIPYNWSCNYDSNILQRNTLSNVNLKMSAMKHLAWPVKTKKEASCEHGRNLEKDPQKEASQQRGSVATTVWVSGQPERKHGVKEKKARAAGAAAAAESEVVPWKLTSCVHNVLRGCVCILLFTMPSFQPYAGFYDLKE